jgi:acetyl esterase/lipase
MENVKISTDLKYTVSKLPQLLMDVYLPADLSAAERKPAVFFLHGNVPPGSPAKNMGVFKSWGRLVAASGLAGVAFTHRLGYPKPLLEEAAADVASAIEYVRSKSDSLGIDCDRICLMAFSGGGPLLSIAMRSKPAYVRCLAAFYAFLDIQGSEMYAPYETPETIERFSPISYLDDDAERIAPMFIARAGLDEVPGINDSIDRFVREAISKNAAITFANHPNGIHGFDNQTDDERSREIIESAIAFMRFQLNGV